jgi:hypothetical protein
MAEDFETPPYLGVIKANSLIPSVPVKAYFFDIQGRARPELYEWDSSDLSYDEVGRGIERLLLNTPHVGVPHIVATMPSFTRAYRFGDPRNRESETNIYQIGIWNTPDVVRGSVDNLGPETIGCLQELDLLAEEVRFWANSESVEEYLTKFVEEGVIIVKNPRKLRGLSKV